MTKTSYHHGDLANALIRAAEDELIEHGVTGFSLRRCAKRAGVSHAAPAHTFGNVNGLQSALVETGFRRLIEVMVIAAADATDPLDRLVETGMGYIAFAQDNRALFELMFGGHVTREVRSDETSAGAQAFEVLCAAVADLRGVSAITSEDDWQAVAVAWSVVHGQGHLLNGGHLRMNDCDDVDGPRRALLAATFAGFAKTGDDAN